MSTSYIGELVKRFESGTKGSTTLGSCGNDWGLSCGSYQLMLRYGNCIRFLKKYFPEESEKLYFNTGKKDVAQKEWPGKDYSSSPDEVKEVWKACLKKAGGDKFFEYEHDYIKAQYYNGIRKKVKEYLDLDNTSRALQECFWSWSVHRGVGGAYNEFKKALGDKDIEAYSFEELFDLIYDMRYETTKFDRYKKGLASSEREVLRPYVKVAGVGVASISSPKVLTAVKEPTLHAAEVKTTKKSTTSIKVKVTATSGLNIRREAESSAKKVGVLPHNKEVTISKFNTEKSWGYVTYGEVTGWICLAYVEEV